MAFDAFIKIGDIKGEATDSKHKDEIEVYSFHYGVTNAGQGGHGTGHGSGKCTVNDSHLVHKVDKSSPVLFQRCATGEHIKEALFTVRKAGGDKLEYLKVKLTGLIVSDVRPGGSAHGADDIPLEEVGLNFGKIEIDYQPQGADGKAAGGPVHGGWDTKLNVKA